MISFTNLLPHIHIYRKKYFLPMLVKVIMCSLSNLKTTLEIDEKSQYEDLRQGLCQALGMSEDTNFKFIFNCKILGPNKQIDDFGIKDGSVCAYMVSKKKTESKPVIAKQKNTETKQEEKSAADFLLLKSPPPPYSPEELKTKYPNIDFTKLPPEQPFNDAPVNSTGKATLIKEMLSQNPRPKALPKALKVW